MFVDLPTEQAPHSYVGGGILLSFSLLATEIAGRIGIAGPTAIFETMALVGLLLIFPRFRVKIFSATDDRLSDLGWGFFILGGVLTALTQAQVLSHPSLVFLLRQWHVVALSLVAMACAVAAVRHRHWALPAGFLVSKIIAITTVLWSFGPPWGLIAFAFVVADLLAMVPAVYCLVLIIFRSRSGSIV